jgi:hypothetical protein
MSAPTRREEIQFLLRAGEIRREAATSGDETQAAIALATLRLAIAAERIADALEAQDAAAEPQEQRQGTPVGSEDPVAADAGETPAELLAALRWAAQRLGQQDPKDHINQLLIKSRDWAIPCRPFVFDCGGGWRIRGWITGGGIEWFYCDPHFENPSGNFPTARAAWEALQRDPRYPC